MILEDCELRRDYSLIMDTPFIDQPMSLMGVC